MQNKHTVRNTLKKAFSVIPNEVIQNPSLSPQARFLYAYMASMSPEWEFYHVPLMANTGWSSDTLSKYLNELLDFGYLTREERRVGGMFAGWDYTIHAEPVTVPEKNRNGKKPERKNSEVINTNTLSLKEIPVFDPDPEVRIMAAKRHLLDHFREHPGRAKEILNAVRLSLSKEQFYFELDDWLEHSSDSQQIICSPVKALTSGPGNFKGWLRKPWCIQKYTTKPEQSRAAAPAGKVYYEPQKRKQ